MSTHENKSRSIHSFRSFCSGWRPFHWLFLYTCAFVFVWLGFQTTSAWRKVVHKYGHITPKYTKNVQLIKLHRSWKLNKNYKNVNYIWFIAIKYHKYQRNPPARWCISPNQYEFSKSPAVWIGCLHSQLNTKSCFHFLITVESATVFFFPPHNPFRPSSCRDSCPWCAGQNGAAIFTNVSSAISNITHLYQYKVHFDS
jgi:hypothetical protein